MSQTPSALKAERYIGWGAHIIMYTSTVTQFEEPPKKSLSETIVTEHIPLQQEAEVKQPLIWRNIIGIAVLHVAAVTSFIMKSHEAHFWTWIFSAVYGTITGFGITAGAHRLWAHKSYSAKLPLRIFLAYLYCMGGEEPPANQKYQILGLDIDDTIQEEINLKQLVANVNQ
ncbi:hypothetical protein PV326_001191 [Microctonus aethiopoides]|nr:hypothetical protein PV326_001191 [Microctonus aethiopoides]